MSRRLLVTGPDQSRLSSLEGSFRNAGHHIIASDDLNRALTLARQFVPDALVLVTDLTTQAGLEWLAMLSTAPGTASLPLFVLSAEATPALVLRAIMAGAFDVAVGATKPFALLSRLDAVLARADAGRLGDRDSGPGRLRRLVETMRQNHATGTLCITGVGAPASITLDNGRVADMVFGDAQGRPALAALLEADDGDWGFAFETERQSAVPPPLPADAAIDATLELDITVDLDLSVSEAPPALPAPTHAALAALPPLTVLLVDDDPSLLSLYSTFLRRSGMAVATAENGAEGLEKAKQLRPELVISDVMMPELDGWGFLSSLRSDAALRETPFVLLSCHHDYLDKLRDVDAGADDYLEKGIRLPAFLERISDVAQPRRDFMASLRLDAPFSGRLERLGIQWLLRALAEAGAEGTLRVEDGFAHFAIGFVGGAPATIEARIAQLVETGPDALRMLLAVDAGEFIFDPHEAPSAFRLSDPLDALLHAAITRTNADLSGLGTRLLSRTTPVRVHAPLLTLYRANAPAALHPVLDSLVSGDPPSVALQHTDNVELATWALKDMARKNVISLS